jgi:hypothetical protein
VRIFSLFSTRWRVFLLLLAISVGSYVALHVWKERRKFIGVSFSGVQHMGSRYAVSGFYVDGGYGSNIGRGGGGGMICCVALPEKWRPGMTAEIRWNVLHWSDNAPIHLDPSTPEIVDDAGTYRAAKVPVEKYDEPGMLWVHFFPGGLVRVVVSNVGPQNDEYPIRRGEPREALRATKGIPVTELFSKAELAELNRKAEQEKPFFGDWR